MSSKIKIILGIETSCDETAAAILQKTNARIIILSNIVASSASMQSKYGGIIPEQAAREQIKSIIPVIKKAIDAAQLTINEIDAIAVTYGPGLIGSLLVGVETAKVLSLIWNKPLIPVNHLLGHFYANWINVSEEGDRKEGSRRTPAAQLLQARRYDGKPTWQDPKLTLPTFPCLGLLVSGGHTDLVIFKSHNKYEYLGGTRDDAAGECFDKSARLLGLPYPGGPEISKLASLGDAKKFKLPIPMTQSNDYDFSFSGLKTAVSNLVSEELRKTQKTNNSDKPANWNTDNQSLSESFRTDISATIEETIIKHLINKTLKAAQKYNIEQIIVAGGVAANNKLRDELDLNCKLKIKNYKLYFPPSYLCMDNASMIVSRAFFQKPIRNCLEVQADPSISLN